MPYGMICVELAGKLSGPGAPTDPAGAWLKAYDPEAHEGRGSVEWTDDVAQAIAFDSPAQAWAAWDTQSVACPFRPDGEPNKPLRAFSICIAPLQD